MSRTSPCLVSIERRPLRERRCYLRGVATRWRGREERMKGDRLCLREFLCRPPVAACYAVPEPFAMSAVRGFLLVAKPGAVAEFTAQNDGKSCPPNIFV